MTLRRPQLNAREILANPAFGKKFTDHMVVADWNAEQGWHNLSVQPYAPLTLDPATTVFHYGQAIFEGIKAYRQSDDSIVTFRPEKNAQRIASPRSAWQCRKSQNNYLSKH